MKKAELARGFKTRHLKSKLKETALKYKAVQQFKESRVSLKWRRIFRLKNTINVLEPKSVLM